MQSSQAGLLLWYYYSLNLQPLCSLGLSANQPAVFFSHIESAPATSQPAVFFFHNKSAPATTKRTE